MFARTMGLLLCCVAITQPALADAQWNVGVSGGSGGITGFNLSIGEYYRVPEREVVVVHERGIAEEELPVVFFIAQRAHVRPEAVVDLRLRGMSWMDITLHFGLNPHIYYVPVVIGREYHPYGPAYGYYRSHPRGGWKRGDLRDRDIINQVNLKFLSEHHRYAPEKIMRSRSEGRSFTTIERDIRGQKPSSDRYQKPGGADQKKYQPNAFKPNTKRPGTIGQERYQPKAAKPDGNKQDQHIWNGAQPPKR
ncbi:MAG: hypothetical protein ABFD81_18035 [Syntrophaceae bacterium]